MSRRTVGPIPVLAALISLLVPAGVVAATTVDGGRAEGDRRASAAGFLQESIEGQVASRSPEATVGTTTAPAPAPAPAVPPTTSRNPARTATTSPAPTTATTVRPGQTTSPTFTIPSGLPLTTPPSTIPGGSSWSNQAGGVSVRMRMVPANPLAGQPVTFYVDDLITQDPCCVVGLRFGDSPTFHNLGGGNCDSPTSLTGLSITHTYAAPGAYEAVLATATFPCRPITSGPAGVPVHPEIHGVGLHVCVVVGPGDAGAGGCPSPQPVIYSVRPPAG